MLLRAKDSPSHPAHMGDFPTYTDSSCIYTSYIVTHN